MIHGCRTARIILDTRYHNKAVAPEQEENGETERLFEDHRFANELDGSCGYLSHDRNLMTLYHGAVGVDSSHTGGAGHWALGLFAFRLNKH